MDIQIRKQLEQLEYIKDKLEYIEYRESLQCYVEKLNGIPTGVAAWVNGAFYGFEQAAKAQAVPASINDIQSWIAVNSFSALDAADDNVPIVDANELAKYIDSLSLGVSVPEGFVLVPKEPTRQIYRTFHDAFNSANAGNTAQCFKVAYKAMIEAQEQAND